MPNFAGVNKGSVFTPLLDISWLLLFDRTKCHPQLDLEIFKVSANAGADEEVEWP